MKLQCVKLALRTFRKGVLSSNICALQMEKLRQNVSGKMTWKNFQTVDFNGNILQLN